MPRAIKAADLARVQSIDFVSRFATNIRMLMAVLGIMQPIKQAPGTLLKSYKTVGELAPGDSSEGTVIPLSHYETKPDRTHEIDLERWRKRTTMKAIQTRGYDQAVTQTDTAMLGDIQGGVRKKVFDFLAAGSGAAGGGSFQAALAQSWGVLKVAFEDTDATPVYFVNPLDIADYLSTAAITMQTAFGFSYVENFLGLGTVIADSHVERGKVYATAKENLNLYFVNAKGIDGFEFVTDETGLVGVHHDPVYQSTDLDTVAVSGVTLFPEFNDRIVIAEIGSGIAGVGFSAAVDLAAPAKAKTAKKAAPAKAKTDSE